MPHLRQRGGTLINVGSVTSDCAVPLQAVYSASKQAIKGFTDALRMELEEERAPVSVTLVKPGSINTPFFEHARNYMEVEPKPPPPVYAPEVVAEAILHCATKPVRDVVVGGGGKVLSALGTRTPRLADRFMERTQFRQQRTDQPARTGDTLYAATDQFHRGRGRYQGHVMQSSAYTALALNRRAQALAMLGLGLALVAGFRALRADRHDLEPEGAGAR